jgi:hypothetical protein
MLLNDAVQVLEPAIVDCWSQIGYDVLQAVEATGETIDNWEAVETCLDADRLWLVIDNRPAWQLAKDLFKQYDYHTVIDFLSKRIQLV